MLGVRYRYKDNARKIYAIALRQQGLTYAEILKHVTVAKSTLSLWLRSVKLSKKQVQRLTEKKLLAAKKGGTAKREQRLTNTISIVNQAISEVGILSQRELWLIGIALYWAEGAKQKIHNLSQQALFSNSDPSMIVLFLNWIRSVLKLGEGDYKCEIYIHENAKSRIEKVIEYWSEITNRPQETFQHIYFKKNKHKTSYRKNKGENYYGLLRIGLYKSTNLNRRIQGWIEGIYKNCRVV